MRHWVLLRFTTQVTPMLETACLETLHVCVETSATPYPYVPLALPLTLHLPLTLSLTLTLDLTLDPTPDPNP